MITLTLLNLFAMIWIAIALIAFPFLLKTTQPYGRHVNSNWGPLMSNRLGWMIQEAPSMIFLSVFFFEGSGPKTPAIYLFWFLWICHYINRSFIFPLRTRTKNKKIPVLIVLSAIGFNFINGFLNGTFFGNFGANYTNEIFTTPHFIFGAIFFAAGVWINNQSDTILIHLRKPGETGYKIPEGGLFRFISCPNHFGEIVEWFGFAVMVNSYPAWSFSLWTAVNLIPRALDHHRWYLQKFSAYPKNRKAVVPFAF